MLPLPLTPILWGSHIPTVWQEKALSNCQWKDISNWAANFWRFLLLKIFLMILFTSMTADPRISFWNLYTPAPLILSKVPNPVVILHFFLLLKSVHSLKAYINEWKKKKKRDLNSVQSLSRVPLFAPPWTAECQASLFITNSQSLPKLMSIESVMPSNHLIHKYGNFEFSRVKQATSQHTYFISKSCGLRRYKCLWMWQNPTQNK